MSALLEIRALRKSFGGLVVADDVSFSLHPGARAALIGPNGAGKTTLIDLVAGLQRADGGSIHLCGRDVTRASPVGRVRAGLARSFQVTRLFPEMTPEEHVALAILQREGWTGRLAGHYRAMPGVMAEVEDGLERLGITSVKARPVEDIAYGEQRLVELAVVLAMRPKVLLLDEPAAGVPQGETGRIERAIATLPADLAVLMIDHDMDLVFRFAHQVLVMAAGRVIFSGPPAAAGSDARVREAYLGSQNHAGRAA